METIAREAGVSPATIYNYFDTSENLIREVSRELVRNMIEKIRELMDADTPFPQKVAEMFSAKMDFIGDNREMLGKLLSRYDSIAGDLSEITELSNEFFESGKKQGYIDPSFDNELINEYFDLIRAGVAAKSGLARRFWENPRVVNDFTRLMKKDVGLFK